MIKMTWKDPIAIIIGSIIGYALLPEINAGSESRINVVNVVNNSQLEADKSWNTQVLDQVDRYFEQFIIPPESQVTKEPIVIEDKGSEETLFIDNKHYVLVATFEKEKAYAVLKQIDFTQGITEDMLLLAINDHVSQYIITDIKRTQITLQSEESAPLVLQLFNLDEDSNDNDEIR